MTTHQDQLRTPGGTPEGGQWAPRARTEADVNLPLSDEDYNATGTFLFPPVPRNYEQFVSFWENVEVSDRVLGNIVLGYERMVDAERHYSWNENESAWLLGNKITRLDLEKKPKAQERHEQEYERWSAEFDLRLMPTIPRQDARQVARAGQMADQAQYLPDEDAERAMKHTFNLSGTSMSVRDINDMFRLEHLRKYFVEPETSIIREISDFRSEQVVQSRDLYQAIQTGPVYDPYA